MLSFFDVTYFGLTILHVSSVMDLLFLADRFSKGWKPFTSIASQVTVKENHKYVAGKNGAKFTNDMLFLHFYIWEATERMYFKESKDGIQLQVEALQLA